MKGWLITVAAVVATVAFLGGVMAGTAAWLAGFEADLVEDAEQTP